MNARSLASVRLDATLLGHVLVVLSRADRTPRAVARLLPVPGRQRRRSGRRRVAQESPGWVRHRRQSRPGARRTSAGRAGVVGLGRPVVVAAGSEATLGTGRSHDGSRRRRRGGGVPRRRQRTDDTVMKGVAVDQRNIQRVETERRRRCCCCRRRRVEHVSRLPDLGRRRQRVVTGRPSVRVVVVVLIALHVAVRRRENAADAEVSRSASRLSHLPLVAPTRRAVFRRRVHDSRPDRGRHYYFRFGHRRSVGAARHRRVVARRTRRRFIVGVVAVGVCLVSNPPDCRAASAAAAVETRHV